MPLPRAGDSPETPLAEWVLEEFGSLDTKVERPAVGDNNFSWIENFMPIATGRARTLYAEASTLYTSASIIYIYSYVIGGVAYWAVFRSDGTATQVAVIGGFTTTMGSGFYTGGQALPACAQWQSKYLLIISQNGYWAWNGTLLFSAGGLAPDVTITNAGSDYTGTPTIAFYGGSGSGASATAQITSESVTNVTITNPGSGYSVGDVVQLGFSGGGSDDTAVAIAIVDPTVSGVSSVVVTNPGHSYTTAINSAFSGGGGSGAQAVAGTIAAGQVQSIIVINPGIGYTSSPTFALTAGGGTGFTAFSEITAGQVTTGIAVAPGSGYSAPPVVTVTGDGQQASAAAVVIGGGVAGINMINEGFGYTTATMTLSGGNRAAAATVSLWPVGITGTTIETYQGRVWIGNGVNLLASAPGTVSDFSISAGGVITQVTDSNLKTQITCLKQSNGYLYGFGDSSVFSVTNVQTSAAGITSYNLSNVDPQIGTNWRDSVVSLGRAIVFANPSGVYALYGGAAEKVSSQLDGLFEKADFTTVIPTSAVATIYNIRVYMMNFRTVDPFTGAPKTVMAMWDGNKWFIGSQLKTPAFVQTQEIASNITAWATDGANLYQMFQTPSTSLTKIMQSKLRKAPNYTSEKRSLRYYLMAYNNAAPSSVVDLAIDSDKANGVATAILPIEATGGAGNVKINIDPTGISAYGQLLGWTLTTTAQDLDIISTTMQVSELAPVG